MLAILAGIGCIIYGLSAHRRKDMLYRQLKADYHKRRQRYETAMQEYREKREAAEREYAKRGERVAKQKKRAQKEYELAEKRYTIAKYELEALEPVLKETKTLLTRLYGSDILFPKYRNMIAVSTMYEYFASGRVSSLEGPDGAYNLFEAEVRQNLIINKLDQVIGRLDEIKENQYSLYVELQKANVQLARVSLELDAAVDTLMSIEALTGQTTMFACITALCAYASAKNTEILKYITLLG